MKHATLVKKDKTMNGRFVINRNRAKVMGVCSGLADWLQVDVLVVRLGVVLATLMTGPVAVLIYILTGWLAGEDR